VGKKCWAFRDPFAGGLEETDVDFDTKTKSSSTTPRGMKLGPAANDDNGDDGSFSFPETRLEKIVREETAQTETRLREEKEDGLARLKRRVASEKAEAETARLASEKAEAMLLAQRVEVANAVRIVPH